jgi:Xaa-Pro aminopeptidase
MPELPSAAIEELVRQKQDQAIDYLQEHGVDAWLLFVREGIDDITTSLVTGASYVVQNAGFIFTREGRKIAVLQPIDIQNKAGLFFDEVVPAGLQIDETIAQELAKLDPRQVAVNFSRNEFCADGLTHGMYLRLHDLMSSVNLSDRIVSAEDLVVSVRAIKTPEELSRIRTAAEITDEATRQVMEIMKPGVTEQAMSDFFRTRARELGAETLESSVAANPIGENDKGHKGRPIMPGDVIVSDMDTRYKGYGSDLKRCWYVLKEDENEVPELLQRQWEACHASLDASLKALTAGRPGYEVHDIGWAALEECGFVRDEHSYGHQLGRRAHDAGPWLGDKENQFRPATGLLGEQMIVTLDPTINRVGIQNPGCYSVGMEEMGIVGKSEGTLLQPAQKDIYLVRL